MDTSSRYPWEQPEQTTPPQRQEGNLPPATSPSDSSWGQPDRPSPGNSGAGQNLSPHWQFRQPPQNQTPQISGWGSNADVSLWNAFTQQRTGDHRIEQQEANSWGAFSSDGRSETWPPQQPMQPGWAYPPIPQGQSSDQPPLIRKPQQRKKSNRRLFIILGITLVVLVVLGGTGLFYFRSALKHSLSGSLSGLTISDTIPLTDLSLSGTQTYRFDYQTIDPQKGWLITTRSGADTVMVFD